MRKAFDGDVMGYEAVLIKDGQVVAQAANGMARNVADGNVKMNTSMPANIGSTIKFTGGITLLNLFESKNTTINPHGWSVDQWLDQPIYHYFPAIWQSNMDASIKQIKFRHLLQHRSGFRGLTANDKGDDGLKRMYDYLEKGIDQANFDVRSYQNANFSLITYLTPVIADPGLLTKVNQEAFAGNWKPEGAEIHKRIADAWEKHIHGHIYSQITPPIRPSCNPTVEYPKMGRSWAPDYKSAGDDDKGTTRDSRASNGYCQAQGGWYITARELAAFVANYHASNTLVSGATRDKLFDDDQSNERMVWSFTIGDTAINEKFHYKSLPYMGGDHGGAHATILALPGGYFAVGIINSDDFSSYGVTARLLRGFKTAIGIAEDPSCPGLGTAIIGAVNEVALRSSQLQAAQDANAGAAAIRAAYNNLTLAQAKLATLRAKAETAVCSL
ncbi:serine hydrolase [Oxalobacteraceae bacterium]|nr:serine hydrolase [Oxalobacteraceae bacterium]